MRILVAAVVITVLVSFYIISFRLNRKQELPKDIKDSLKSCSACDSSGCGLHPNQRGE